MKPQYEILATLQCLGVSVFVVQDKYATFPFGVYEDKIGNDYRIDAFTTLQRALTFAGEHLASMF